MTTDTILFYTPGTCSLASMIALGWLGEPYRLCRVDKEERRTAAYLRVNPRGQVPTLWMDGRTLFETNAILAHLADRRPEAGLLPENGAWPRDVANQWLAYLGSGFHPPFWPYFTPARYVTDPLAYKAVQEAAVASIRRELALVDAHLAERAFILGDRLSVLDVYLYAMDRWANQLVDMPLEYPGVWRHQKATSRDPLVRAAVALERALPAALATTVGGPLGGHVTLAELAG